MEAMKGIDHILLFRRLGDTSKGAAKLWFQIEHSQDGSVEGGDSTVTKDGTISAPGTPQEEIPFSGVVAREDACYEMLLEAYRKQETVEVWVIDKGAEPTVTGEDPNQTTQYPAEYAQGRISEFNRSANAEGLVEVDATLVVDLIPQKGMATLNAEQAKAAQYPFKDTTPSV